MGYALVFSGQGLQHPGMLGWVAPDPLGLALDRMLDNGWRDRLSNAAWATENRVAQPLITGLALAAWGQLAPLLPPPDIVCGYSVGELAAFAAAGVFDGGTALALALQRAACMDAASALAGPTGLLAVGGASPAGLRTLCERFDLDVAIRIDPGHAVLGGPCAALAEAEPVAAAQGLRATRLQVAMASHTRWMAGAAHAFGQVLAATPLNAPRTRLHSNALGAVRGADQARDALSRQIAQTVAWDYCLEAMGAQRVDAVLEIGAGDALARMWSARHPRVPARSADEFSSAPAVAVWLNRQMG